jgi:hypothetical protein
LAIRSEPDAQIVRLDPDERFGTSGMKPNSVQSVSHRLHVDAEIACGALQGATGDRVSDHRLDGGLLVEDLPAGIGD